MKKVEITNSLYPHEIRIVRMVAGDWLDDDESEQELVVYEGSGRSYTDTTTNGDNKVDTNKRKCSIPKRYDAWGELFPMSGDMVYVTKGNIKEKWEVKDFEPDNLRSVVYGEMNRNSDV